MKLYNEAVRMFMAIAALILTAMLTNPPEESLLANRSGILIEKTKVSRELASPSVARPTRILAMRARQK